MGVASGPVRLVFVAELRRRWRPWLAIALLVSLVGGFVLAATVAGRRTDAAYPSFVAKYGFDAATYAARPVPQLTRLPEVASAVKILIPASGQPTCSCGRVINATDFAVDTAPSDPRAVSKLISGQWPSPSSPDEVLASFTLQKDYGLRIGTVLRVPLYARVRSCPRISMPWAVRPPRMARWSRCTWSGSRSVRASSPRGPRPPTTSTPRPRSRGTVVPRTAPLDVYLVRLRHGAADLPRFIADSNSLSSAGAVGSQNLDQLNSSIEGSIHPQAIGWFVLAILAALVGLFVISQALSRQSTVESEEYGTLASLGVEQRQLVALASFRNLVVGVVGAVGAVVLAVALSPLTPVGEARLAEPATGTFFDTLVLPLGLLALVLVVVALGLWPAVRRPRVR